MKNTIVLSVLLIAALVVLPATTDSFDSQEKESVQQEINQLLSERRDVLRQRLKAVERTHEFAPMIETLMEAKNDLLDAESELVTTQAERIRLHKEKVENFRTIERVLEARFKGGNAPVVELLSAKADRLLAQIELLRASED